MPKLSLQPTIVGNPKSQVVRFVQIAQTSTISHKILSSHPLLQTPNIPTIFCRMQAVIITFTKTTILTELISYFLKLTQLVQVLVNGALPKLGRICAAPVTLREPVTRLPDP